MRLSWSPKLGLLVLAFLAAAALSAAAVSGVFTAEAPPAPSAVQAPARAATAPPVAASGDGPTADASTDATDTAADAPTLLAAAAVGGGGGGSVVAPAAPGGKPLRPPAGVKDPIISITPNGDGSYRIAWANLVPVYRVYVDSVMFTTTNLTSVDYTPPGPGRYAVRVTDSKNVSVSGEIDRAGVLAEGANDYGQLNVSGWSNVTDIAAGYYHTVGLTSAGTALATGSNTHGQCDVGAWTGLTDVEAGWNHTLGLKADGTVVATGRNDYGQTVVSGWSGITGLAAGTSFSAGLKSDGTVVAVGRNQYGQCNVAGWTDIVAIACGSVHTLGLKSDGSVVYAGPSAATGGMFNLGQGNVGAWSGVSALGAGHTHSLGVSGGSVRACGSNPDGALVGLDTWTGLVSLDGGLGNTVGLRSDGTALIAGQWWDNGAAEYVPYAAVQTWTGLDQVSAQGDFVVGLVK